MNMIFEKMFRTDLKLNDKWFHRVFKVIFILWLLFFIYAMFKDYTYNHSKYNILVDPLENRLNDWVIKIENILRPWEVFSNNSFNDKDWIIWWEWIYCSNKLYNIDNLDYIISDSWINNFNALRSNKWETSKIEFSNLLKAWWTKCITKDNAEIVFLNDLSNYFNEFWFYKPSPFWYLMDPFFIPNHLTTVLVYIFVLYIAYYQIFLYIVYWKKNNKN